MNLPMPFTLLVALNDSTAKQFNAGTAWFRVEEVAFVRATFEQMASQTHFRASFAYQLCNDPNVAGVATGVGAALTADGMNFGSKVDISAALLNARFIRFGWLVWFNDGGAAPLFARCGGQAEVWGAED